MITKRTISIETRYLIYFTFLKNVILKLQFKPVFRFFGWPIHCTIRLRSWRGIIFLYFPFTRIRISISRYYTHIHMRAHTHTHTHVYTVHTYLTDTKMTAI